MGYKNLKYIPYKISCVSFVPHAQYNVEQLQIVVSSRMEKSDDSNKLLVFSINAESIVKECEVDVNSRITDMGWLNSDTVIAGSKSGETVLYRLKDDVSAVYNWSKEDKEITSVSVFEHARPNDPAFVRTTENGTISVMSTTSQSALRSYHDECSVRCSIALSSGQVMSGNQFGQAKLWDLRTNDVDCVKSLDLATSTTSLLSIAQHPGRTHLILGGCSDGNLSLWDLRNGSQPVSYISRHSGPVWTLKFHPLAPVAFSGGADSKILAQTGNWEEEFSEIKAKDLSSDSLIDSINSISLSGDYLAAGGDDCCLIVASIR